MMDEDHFRYKDQPGAILQTVPIKMTQKKLQNFVYRIVFVS